MRLVDSDVVVDILRRYQPALDWLDALEEVPGIPGFVVMELVAGCRNRQQMRQLLRRTAPFAVYWPAARDCERALATFMRAHFTHRLGLVDAVIGECAVGLQATLCTFNVRHFRAIPQLAIEQPYVR